ncbi:MAG TPA: tetratricopeptide repeat protein, partial [Clostridia bacterium]
SITGKNAAIPDNILDSIALYNKAIGNIKLGSEDIAVIELKRAISLNPDFHEAMNLLGLCYIYLKEYSKAQEAFEKVALHENNGVKAMSYIAYIEGSDTVSGVQPKAKAVPENKSSKISKKETKLPSNDILEGIPWLKKLYYSKYVKYIAVFALGVLLSAIVGSLTGSNKNVTVPSSAAVTKPADSVPDTKEADVVKKELEDTKVRLESVSKELDLEKRISKLIDADSFVGQKRYEDAADILVALKGVTLDAPQKSKFDDLYDTAIPRAAWAAFNEGNSLMVQKNYQDALKKLGKVQVYGSEWAYLDITLYNMGVCYKESGDSKNALDKFNEILTKYPNSKYVDIAKSRIDEINEQP